MKYLKPILVFFLIGIVSSCVNPSKEISNPINEDDESIQKEVINPSIDSLVNGLVESEHFIGGVLVAKNDQVIHAKGYGMANDSMENTIHTKFHVASITKQFTAAAIMQLLEQDKISLTESINEFLPNKYRTDNWDEVTIHHLLSHTSGVPDYGVARDYYNVVNGFCLGNTVDGMIKEAMRKKLRFPPGTQFSYSNIGFTLLGQIIEQVSDEPYHRYIREKILDPMEMNDSYIHTTDYVVASDDAIGYRWDEEEGKHVFDDIVSLPVTQPDGNLVTTLYDFLKWTDIYGNNKQQIFQESSISRMTKPYILKRNRKMELTSGSYGYGLTIDEGTISHGGYIVGFRSHFILDTEENIRIIVFNNNVSNNPQGISRGVYGMMKTSSE